MFGNELLAKYVRFVGKLGRQWFVDRAEYALHHILFAGKGRTGLINVHQLMSVPISALLIGPARHVALSTGASKWQEGCCTFVITH